MPLLLVLHKMENWNILWTWHQSEHSSQKISSYIYNFTNYTCASSSLMCSTHTPKSWELNIQSKCTCMYVCCANLYVVEDVLEMQMELRKEKQMQKRWRKKLSGSCMHPPAYGNLAVSCIASFMCATVKDGAHRGRIDKNSRSLQMCVWGEV